MTLEDSTKRFVLWATERLGLVVTPARKGTYVMRIPPVQGQVDDFVGEVNFTFEREVYSLIPPNDPLELITPGGRLLTWLIDQVRRLGNVAHASPPRQPNSVQELAGPLLAGYEVENGHAHLAGCTLEARPILRATYRLRLEGLEPRDELLEIHASSDEQLLPPETVATLGLEELQAMPQPPKIVREELDRLVHRANAAAEERRRLTEGIFTESLLPKKLEELRQLEDYFAKTKQEVSSQRETDSPAEEQAALDEQLATLDEQFRRRLGAVEERYTVQGRLEFVAATLIWCKYAAGKLRFTIGDQAVDLSFADWAGQLQPPPFICPYTSRPTRRIAATDDGRIAAAEEIAACEETQRRVLKKELVRCAMTGKLVLSELTELCPVSGDYVLKPRLVPCPVCTVRVSPRILRGEQGACCPAPQLVSKDEPRMARILGEYPKLDAWRNWKLAESPVVYLLTGAGLWRQMLVALDKRTLEPLRVAFKTRLAARWIDVPAEQREGELR